MKLYTLNNQRKIGRVTSKKYSVASYIFGVMILEYECLVKFEDEKKETSVDVMYLEKIDRGTK